MAADYVRGGHDGSETVEPQGQRRKTVSLAEQLARDIRPIDWANFWATDPPPEEWVLYPIVPARRQVATYSPAKSGKSLLALDAAASLASGRSVLGQAPSGPRSVVYMDFEMTDDDVRERLIDLGYGPEDDLSRLAYYQLPSLPPLDTQRGGQVLEEVVRRHSADLVVIDTMARVVLGDENDADTYRSFFAFSGVRLKRLGVALWRLDHAGKDPTHGQRGSSAKADDVDVVFRLSIVDDKVVLERTHSRVPWVPPQIAIRRETDPLLRHVLTDDNWPAGTKECADLLDELGVPLDATLSMAIRDLKHAGKGRRRQLVAAGLKFRKLRSGAKKSVPENLGTAQNVFSSEPLGTVTSRETKPHVNPSESVPGTAGNHLSCTAGTRFPSLEGTGPGTSSDDADYWSSAEAEAFLASIEMGDE